MRELTVEPKRYDRLWQLLSNLTIVNLNCIAVAHIGGAVHQVSILTGLSIITNSWMRCVVVARKNWKFDNYNKSRVDLKPVFLNSISSFAQISIPCHSYRPNKNKLLSKTYKILTVVIFVEIFLNKKTPYFVEWI